jgi:hypothetical protein
LLFDDAHQHRGGLRETLGARLEIALGAGYLDNDDLGDVLPLVARLAALLSDIVRGLGPDIADSE